MIFDFLANYSLSIIICYFVVIEITLKFGFEYYAWIIIAVLKSNFSISGNYPPLSSSHYFLFRINVIVMLINYITNGVLLVLFWVITPEFENFNTLSEQVLLMKLIKSTLNVSRFTYSITGLMPRVISTF